MYGLGLNGTQLYGLLHRNRIFATYDGSNSLKLSRNSDNSNTLE
jgi:hypothetical protein